MSRASLGAFLATARKALASPPAQGSKPLTFVVGNESADLDSLCSALLLAYFRSQCPPHHRLHIPLANIPKADLQLRTELDAVLRHTDAKTSDLLTLSDLPQGLSPENTRWVLVDHNALTGDIGQQFSEAIVGCVDHHEDEGTVPADCADEPRVIRKCGSCMSLVVEQCRDVWKDLALKDSDSGSALDAALARVALGPILVDTTNLTSKSKTTDTDTEAVELVESYIKDPKYNRKEFFDEITRVKEDISHFDYRDILRKDYKQWHDGGLVLGVSSVVQGFDYMLEKIGGKDALLEALKSWAKERRLDIASIMTVTHKDGEFMRELLMWGINEDGINVAKKFVDKFSDELQLESWRDGEMDDTNSTWRMCWEQHNLAHSRKQVAPRMREAMTGESKL